MLKASTLQILGFSNRFSPHQGAPIILSGLAVEDIFLIDTIDDARVMRDFYETRIQAERHNLNNLRRQAGHVGWNL